MLPAPSGPDGLLPVGKHEASLDQIYERFVVDAPFRERRELIFRALTLHMDLVRPLAPGARLWLDGGFVTHKIWAEPEDADVALIVSVAEFKALLLEPHLPLHTLQNLTALSPKVSSSKLHPMGGLLDVYVVPDMANHIKYWDHQWSRVRGADGKKIAGVSKGYVEVMVSG